MHTDEETLYAERWEKYFSLASSTRPRASGDSDDAGIGGGDSSRPGHASTEHYMRTPRVRVTTKRTRHPAGGEACLRTATSTNTNDYRPSSNGAGSSGGLETDLKGTVQSAGAAAPAPAPTLGKPDPVTYNPTLQHRHRHNGLRARKT